MAHFPLHSSGIPHFPHIPTTHTTHTHYTQLCHACLWWAWLGHITGHTLPLTHSGFIPTRRWHRAPSHFCFVRTDIQDKYSLYSADIQNLAYEKKKGFAHGCCPTCHTTTPSHCPLDNKEEAEESHPTHACGVRLLPARFHHIPPARCSWCIRRLGGTVSGEFWNGEWREKLCQAWAGGDCHSYTGTGLFS